MSRQQASDVGDAFSDVKPEQGAVQRNIEELLSGGEATQRCSGWDLL